MLNLSCYSTIHSLIHRGLKPIICLTLKMIYQNFCFHRNFSNCSFFGGFCLLWYCRRGWPNCGLCRNDFKFAFCFLATAIAELTRAQERRQESSSSVKWNVFSQNVSRQHSSAVLQLSLKLDKQKKRTEKSKASWSLHAINLANDKNKPKSNSH